MADSVISKQELIDAQKDAKSLEEVVNGSETKQVTTRLGENYPSVKKAIKTLFENGGLPATPFANKNLMDSSDLEEGSYAIVTDDANTNNGLYIKENGVWRKSTYSSNRLLNEYIGKTDSVSNIVRHGVLDGQIISTPLDYMKGMSFEVSKGDEFIVCTNGLSLVQSWVVVDINDIVIDVAARSPAISTTLPAPQLLKIKEGGHKLYVNYLLEEEEYSYAFRTNKGFIDYISSLPKASNIYLESVSCNFFIRGSKLVFTEDPKFVTDENCKFRIFSDGALTEIDVASNSFLCVKKDDLAYWTNKGTRWEHSQVPVIDTYWKNITVPDWNRSTEYVPLFYIAPDSANVFAVFAGGSHLARKSSNMDSWFTDGAPTVSQEITYSSEYANISFTKNPRIMNIHGAAAYLFPEGATEFVLPPLNPFSFYYTYALSNKSWTTTPYLKEGDIKKGSFLNAVALEGATIIAYNQNGRLLDIGACGHKLYHDYVRDIPKIKSDIETLKSAINLDEGVRAVFPPEPSYPDLVATKCPKFYKAYKLKNKDVTVCLSGTSMVQGNLYATERGDAKTRPPLLHTNDLASHIYDRLYPHWDGQQYRRYDHDHLVYEGDGWVATATLKTISGAEVWDDNGSDHNGLTRTTVASQASVSIEVPSDAYQFNFIYRTDLEGGDAKVVILEGDNKMEVFNGSNWVEANNFAFSMLEPTPTSTKGNTVYQKRLKMRCRNRHHDAGIDSIGAVKNLKIEKVGTGRFNVVGFEWSKREFMFTFINAARGSHQWGRDGSDNLENYQDGDIWVHNPDLIITEVTLINWGATQNTADSTDKFVDFAKSAYFDELGNNPDSLYHKSNWYQDCEIIFFGSTLSGASAYTHLYNLDTGELKFHTITDGNMKGMTKNGFDHHYAVDEYMKTKKDHIYIPTISTVKKVADNYYGGYWFAMRPSGKDGNTLSVDGTHYNDNGAALWASMIAPLFESI